MEYMYQELDELDAVQAQESRSKARLETCSCILRAQLRVGQVGPLLFQAAHLLVLVQGAGKPVTQALTQAHIGTRYAMQLADAKKSPRDLTMPSRLSPFQWLFPGA